MAREGKTFLVKCDKTGVLVLYHLEGVQGTVKLYIMIAIIISVFVIPGRQVDSARRLMHD